MIELIEFKGLEGKHRTIWSKDKDKFLNMIVNEKLFKQYDVKGKDYKLPRVRLISDKNKVKEILLKYYSSKGRDGYEAGKPSPSVIADTLYPVDLNKELFKLLWLANEDINIIKEQETHNKQSMHFGTYVHLILQLWAISKKPYHQRNLSEIIIQAREHEDIKKYLPDFNENMIEYETTTQKVLNDFIINELIKHDIIGTEYYFRSDRMQGCVDLISMINGKYCISDYKTTKKIYKNTGGRKFSSAKDIQQYHRQLCAYALSLIKAGIIPPYEKDNIDFNIFQFHLLSCEYKVFNVANSEVLKWEESLNNVIDWFHNSIK